jgi:hypothetical protein
MESCRDVCDLLYRSVLSGVILRQLVWCLLWNGTGDFKVELPEKKIWEAMYSWMVFVETQRRGEVSNVHWYDYSITGKLSWRVPKICLCSWLISFTFVPLSSRDTVFWKLSMFWSGRWEDKSRTCTPFGPSTECQNGANLYHQLMTDIDDGIGVVVV